MHCTSTVCYIVTACKEAYVDGESEGACAFGCQGQLPTIEARRKQVVFTITSHFITPSSFLLLLLFVVKILFVENDCCMDC